MAAVKFSTVFISLLVIVILLLSCLVQCKEEDEDRLLQGINTYRTAQNLPILHENDNADCIADEIADDLDDVPCRSVVSTRFSDYPKILRKCKVDLNTTVDGVIMPACVPDLVSTQVLANYTQSQYSGQLNNSKYTGIGLGSEDDWMIVVLATGTSTGSLATTGGANYAGSGIGLSCFMLFLVVGWFLG